MNYNFNMITEKEFSLKNLKNDFCKNGILNVTISCKYIRQLEQFLEALGNSFQLPMRNENLDGTWDWMTDLSWLGDIKVINIFLIKEAYLFCDDPPTKEKVYEWLQEIINFWKNDVKNVYFGDKKGKVKDFKVYIVK